MMRPAIVVQVPQLIDDQEPDFDTGNEGPAAAGGPYNTHMPAYNASPSSVYADVFTPSTIGHSPGSASPRLSGYSWSSPEATAAGTAERGLRASPPPREKIKVEQPRTAWLSGGRTPMSPTSPTSSTLSPTSPTSPASHQLSPARGGGARKKKGLHRTNSVAQWKHRRDSNLAIAFTLNTRHRFFLSFHDADIEAEFREQYFCTYKRYFRLLFAFGTLLWALYLLRKLALAGDAGAWWAQVYIRSICSVLSLLLGVFPCLFTAFFSRHFNAVVTLLVFVWATALTCVSYFEALVKLDLIASVRVASIFALSSLAARTFFLYHMATVIFVAGHAVFCVLFHVGFHDLILVILMYLLSCVVAYESERSHRRVFALQKSAKIDQDSVSALLEVMLPVTVVNRLLERKIVADTFRNVTVLFAEICDFNSRCKQFPPDQVVEMVNGFYKIIDDLAGEDVHQVESLCEQALLITGCPVETNRHAMIMADFALKIRQRIPDMCSWPDGSPLTVKIGIHSGRVIASVIGKKRPQYNIIGDAVNTAARMLSRCESGQIHISEETRDLLHHVYTLNARTPMHYKGKGILRSYYLEISGFSSPLPGPRKTPTSPNSPQRRRLAEILSHPVTRAKISALATSRKLFESKSTKPRVAQIAPPAPQEDIVIPRVCGVRRVSVGNSFHRVSQAAKKDAAMVAALFREDSELYGRFGLHFRDKTVEAAFKDSNKASTLWTQRESCLLLAFFFIATYPYVSSIRSFHVEILVVRLINFVCCLILAACTFQQQLWAMVGKILLMLLTIWTVCFLVIEDFFAGSRPSFSSSTVLWEFFAFFILFRMSAAHCSLSVLTVVLGLLTLFLSLVCSLGTVEILPQLEPLTYLLLMSAFFLLSNFTAAHNARAAWVLRRRAECDKESLNEIVSNILPSHVRDRMMEGLAVSVQTFSVVAMLYSDIVGFTALSATHSPEEMRGILHHLFIFFDNLVEESGLYKVTTIGDAYIICAGCPFACSDPVNKIVNVALGMQEVLREFHSEKYSLQMRIGIHIGPVYAGLVGARAPHYHIFGQTTHIAHFLESAAPPGTVLVSQAAASLLGPQFVAGPELELSVDGEEVCACVVEHSGAEDESVWGEEEEGGGTGVAGEMWTITEVD